MAIESVGPGVVASASPSWFPGGDMLLSKQHRVTRVLLRGEEIVVKKVKKVLSPFSEVAQMEVVNSLPILRLPSWKVFFRGSKAET